MKSTSDQDAAAEVKKHKNNAKPKAKPQNNEEKNDRSNPKGQPQKPRLTIADLEFDYDRSQLRDPRPTLGREVHPRYGAFAIPFELRMHMEDTREIPKPKRPAGRLSLDQEMQLDIDEACINPLDNGLRRVSLLGQRARRLAHLR